MAIVQFHPSNCLLPGWGENVDSNHVLKTTHKEQKPSSPQGICLVNLYGPYNRLKMWPLLQVPRQAKDPERRWRKVTHSDLPGPERSSKWILVGAKRWTQTVWAQTCWGPLGVRMAHHNSWDDFGKELPASWGWESTFWPPPSIAHDCGYPLSRYTCRATRVAADFLDFIAFCRCSSGVAPHPLKILVSHLSPPPLPGGVAPKFGSEKVLCYRGVSQVQLRVSRYTVQLSPHPVVWLCAPVSCLSEGGLCDKCVRVFKNPALGDLVNA